ncbi:MAG: insulinase family protein [Desulfobacterales bacterium]|nr:insulinase family protein [Desulfobacterales bacterium]
MYAKSTLENGVRVVTNKMPGARSMAVGVLVEGGIRDEVRGQHGLAHLVEHLLFQGGANRDSMQIARLIDAAGGQVGAFTARDYTCYTATVLDDHYPFAMELFGDILLHPVFSENALASEISAILREIAAARDSPGDRAHANLKALAWANHPLGRPITGLPEDIRGVTRENVLRFVRDHYSPDRFIVAAAGNVAHKDFAAHAEDAFWNMSGAGEKTGPGPRPGFQSGCCVEHLPVSEAYFSIGARAHRFAHPDRFAVHVFNKMLGGGVSSRLFRGLREERGLVYDIYSEHHAYHEDGLLVVEGSTSPESLMRVLALTLVEMWKLASGDEPVNEEELRNAKMQITAQHLLAGEHTSTRMSRLATQELYLGRHIPTEDVLAGIHGVNAGALRALGEDKLVDGLNRAAIAVVGPEAPGRYSRAAIEELLEKFRG